MASLGRPVQDMGWYSRGTGPPPTDCGDATARWGCVGEYVRILRLPQTSLLREQIGTVLLVLALPSISSGIQATCSQRSTLILSNATCTVLITPCRDRKVTTSRTPHRSDARRALRSPGNLLFGCNCFFVKQKRMSRRRSMVSHLFSLTKLCLKGSYSVT